MKTPSTSLEDRPWTRRLRCALAALALVGALGSGVSAGQVVDASIEEARRALLAGIAERDELSLHASLLIDSRDLTTLAEVLDVHRVESSADAVLATLSALGVRGEPGLVSSLIRLAAASDNEAIATRAADTIVILAREHADVVARLRAWAVDTSMRSADERVLCVRALGASRNLTAVPDLIDLVGGPLGDEAHNALVVLTGHSLTLADTAAWREFWEPRQSLSREELLENELERLRTAPRRAFQQREQQLEQRLSEKDAEIERMTLLYIGTDVDRLAAALEHESRGIRIEVARRLRARAGEPVSANALPMLVRRLVGRSTLLEPGAVDGDVNAGASGVVASDGTALTEDAKTERDPEVRAMLVEALGKIGRLQDGVAAVLLDELESPYAVVSAAAVRALGHQRNRPEIVQPLLSAISAVAVDGELLVGALQTIAANNPDESVLPRIKRWLQSDNTPEVREAAVLAALATPDVGAALGVISLDDRESGVRLRIARGLADAAGGLGQGPVHTQVGNALFRLLGDDDLNVRAEAASALGAWGGESALDWLAERSRRESEASVLKKIVAALGKLGRLEAVDHIGRVCGQQVIGQRTEIVETAQNAIELIGANSSAAEWLAIGRSLSTVKAYGLSSWALSEMERRFGASPEHSVVLEEAKGLHARVLFEDGRWDESRSVLRELHGDGARFPEFNLRLKLLARTNEFLGDYNEAAEYDMKLLKATPEGDVTRFEVQRDAVRTLFQSRDYNTAEFWLDDLISKAEQRDEPEPILVDLLFSKAEILEKLKRSDELDTLIKRLDRLVDGDESRARLADLRRRIAGRDTSRADTPGSAPPLGAVRTG